MKSEKVRNAYIRVLLLTLVASAAEARVSSEYFNWARGQFQIPAEIAAVQKRSDLEAFLNSELEFVRMAAVKRLCQVEKSNASDSLRDIIENEPSPRGRDYVPLVKLEAIRSLGLIEGDKARGVLIGIFNDYWGRIDEIQTDILFRDTDFVPVLSLLTDILLLKAGNPDMISVVRSAALSPEMKEAGILPSQIRQKVIQVYLKGEMVDKGIENEIAQITYLMEELNSLYDKWPFEYRSFDHMMALAVHSLVRKYSIGSVNAAFERYDLELKNRDYAKTGNPSKRRKEIVRSRSFLRKISRDIGE